jgi:hypothetical protein
MNDFGGVWRKSSGFGGSQVNVLGIGVPYTAQGVTFDGTNDYLTRGAGLTGASASATTGIISFWFKLTGGDSTNQLFIEDSNSGVGVAAVIQILRLADNTIRVDWAQSQVGGPYFRAVTSTTYTADATWHHCASWWNVATSQGGIIVDGTNVTSGTPTFVNTAISVAASDDWGICARVSGILKASAEMADFYAAFAQYLDLSNSSNLQKFRSVAGHPVDLGTDGSTPTGTQPDIFFGGSLFGIGHSPADDWKVNRGAGGGFTVNGALTLSANNP